MFTCEICMKIFKRRDNMLRHRKTIHSEDNIDQQEQSDLSSEECRDSCDSDASTDSDVSLEDTSDSEVSIEENDRHVDEYDPWSSVVDKAFEECQDEFEMRVEGLISKGRATETNARHRVFDDMKSTYRKEMMKIFLNRIKWFNAIKKSPVYRKIKKAAGFLTDVEDYSTQEAWKYALSKRKYAFDEILDEYNTPDLNFSSDKEKGEEEEEDRHRKKLKTN